MIIVLVASMLYTSHHHTRNAKLQAMLATLDGFGLNTKKPTANPSAAPTTTPSASPTAIPTQKPSLQPTPPQLLTGVTPSPTQSPTTPAPTPRTCSNIVLGGIRPDQPGWDSIGTYMLLYKTAGNRPWYARSAPKGKPRLFLYFDMAASSWVIASAPHKKPFHLLSHSHAFTPDTVERGSWKGYCDRNMYSCPIHKYGPITPTLSCTDTHPSNAHRTNPSHHRLNKSKHNSTIQKSIKTQQHLSHAPPPCNHLIIRTPHVNESVQIPCLGVYVLSKSVVDISNRPVYEHSIPRFLPFLPGINTNLWCGYAADHNVYLYYAPDLQHWVVSSVIGVGPFYLTLNSQSSHPYPPSGVPGKFQEWDRWVALDEKSKYKKYVQYSQAQIRCCVHNCTYDIEEAARNALGLMPHNAYPLQRARTRGGWKEQKKQKAAFRRWYKSHHRASPSPTAFPTAVPTLQPTTIHPTPRPTPSAVEIEMKHRPVRVHLATSSRSRAAIKSTLMSTALDTREQGTPAPTSAEELGFLAAQIRQQRAPLAQRAIGGSTGTSFHLSSSAIYIAAAIGSCALLFGVIALAGTISKVHGRDQQYHELHSKSDISAMAEAAAREAHQDGDTFLEVLSAARNAAKNAGGNKIDEERAEARARAMMPDGELDHVRRFILQQNEATDESTPIVWKSVGSVCDEKPIAAQEYGMRDSDAV